MAVKKLILPGYKGAEKTDKYKIKAGQILAFEHILVCGKPKNRAEGPSGFKATLQAHGGPLEIVYAISKRPDMVRRKNRPECGCQTDTPRQQTAVLTAAIGVSTPGLVCWLDEDQVYYLSVEHFGAPTTLLMTVVAQPSPNC